MRKMPLTAALTVSLGLCACVIVALAGKQMAFAVERPVIKWVYMADAAPINWQENGVAKGIEVEIVQQICDNLGITVIHEFYPWKRAQEYVKSGEADGMMTTPTTTRFEYAVFGKELAVPEYWNLFIKKGNTKIAEQIPTLKSIEDLKRFRLIDFLGNGWSEAYMKEGYTIGKVPRIDQIPSMLAFGREEISIMSSTWMNWWAENKGISDQIEEYEINWPMTRFHFVLMLSRKSPWVEKGLIRAMDEELKKMKASGQWQEILRKYKNAHGFGKPFQSHLDDAYLTAKGFYADYDTYPIYVKPE